jgi:hypothetical protein
MNILTIRQKIHNYVEKANDKELKAIFAIMEQDIEQKDIEYTEELKNELDKRYSSYAKGESKPVSAAESKMRISNLLSQAGK